MKMKFITLALLLPIYVCQAGISLDDMKRDMDQHMDRAMNQHYETWDRIERNLENEQQKRVDRINIENQGKRLFGR